jgi:hypothetical protein
MDRAVIEGQDNNSPTQEVDLKGMVFLRDGIPCDKSLLTLTSISQASCYRHPITPAAGLKTFIVSRTPSSRARLGPGVK